MAAPDPRVLGGGLSDEALEAIQVLRHYAGPGSGLNDWADLYRWAIGEQQGNELALKVIRLAGLTLGAIASTRASRPSGWPTGSTPMRDERNTSMPGADPNGWFMTPDGRIAVGQVAQLGPQGLWWLARACSADGRYVLLSTVEEQVVECADGEDRYLEDTLAVVYTLIDYEQQIRGAINVIGGGVGIETVCGPDENVDKAMRMVLEDGFEVSHRNQVHLQILDVRSAC